MMLRRVALAVALVAVGAQVRAAGDWIGAVGTGRERWRRAKNDASLSLPAVAPGPSPLPPSFSQNPQPHNDNRWPPPAASSRRTSRASSTWSRSATVRREKEKSEAPGQREGERRLAPPSTPPLPPSARARLKSDSRRHRHLSGPPAPARLSRAAPEALDQPIVLWTRPESGGRCALAHG
jgi:hypothetical protein